MASRPQRRKPENRNPERIGLLNLLRPPSKVHAPAPSVTPERFRNGILNVTLSPIGYNPLPARPISPEGRIGKPVFAKRCYMGDFDVTHITAMSSVLFFGFHSTFCIS